MSLMGTCKGLLDSTHPEGATRILRDCFSCQAMQQHPQATGVAPPLWLASLALLPLLCRGRPSHAPRQTEHQIFTELYMLREMRSQCSVFHSSVGKCGSMFCAEQREAVCLVVPCEYPCTVCVYEH